jgi:hypothetical protein
LFQTHPPCAIITSFPGLADSAGTRVLAEIGDDRSRFVDARALKACAGAAPVTRASGRSISITHRHIKNNRLANVGWMWAFSAATNCEPAREHYRRRRDLGDRHGAATRRTGLSRGSASEKAKRICAQCPVILECRDYSLKSQEPFGVWGGLTEAEREGFSDGRTADPWVRT